MTYIHIRGDFRNKGEQVQPGVPASFHPLPEGAEPNRLNVARWLVSNENPLTARVLVNRYWEQLFGIGIVETAKTSACKASRRRIRNCSTIWPSN